MFSGIIEIEHGLEMGKSKPSPKAALIQPKTFQNRTLKPLNTSALSEVKGKHIRLRFKYYPNNFWTDFKPQLLFKSTSM